MNPKKFFGELKRRNVYKVAVAYILAGWALAQGIAQVLPVFDIPNSVVRLLVLLIIIGFPVAVILAWAFELTPTGIKRTEDVDQSAPERSRNRAWIYVVIIGAVFSIGLFFLGRYTVSRKQSGSAELPKKSIAVLPFENLSSDKENAYFASGIQDEILTKLAAINDLRVISRASTEKYRSHPEDIRRVGSDLGAATILEGSVQKSGDSAHINVQLIDAQTDSHVWAQVYDRELKNIFAVEGEVAEQVAVALKLKLLPSATAKLEAPPTKDAEAYDLYLRGKYAHKEWFRGTGDVEEAFKYFREAIARDPKFAAAYAWLSITESQEASDAVGLNPALEKDARENADKARSLQPDLPLAGMAKGLVYLHFDHNYSNAIDQFRRFSSSSIPEAIAEARLGHFDEAVQTMVRVVDLDPRNDHSHEVLASFYGKARRYKEALDASDRVIALDPNNWKAVTSKAELLLVQGEVTAAREILKKIPAQVIETLNRSNASRVPWKSAFLARDYSDALIIAEEFAAPRPDAIETGERELLMAHAELSLGKRAEAMQALIAARAKVEAVLARHQELPELHQRLAQIQAARGEKQSAIAEAEKAIALLPLSKNADDGLIGLETLAEVYACFGDTDHSIVLIGQLLSADGGGLLMTPALLRLDPVWDPLRNDPRFQKLANAKP